MSWECYWEQRDFCPALSPSLLAFCSSYLLVFWDKDCLFVPCWIPTPKWHHCSRVSTRKKLPELYKGYAWSREEGKKTRDQKEKKPGKTYPCTRENKEPFQISHPNLWLALDAPHLFSFCFETRLQDLCTKDKQVPLPPSTQTLNAQQGCFWHRRAVAFSPIANACKASAPPAVPGSPCQKGWSVPRLFSWPAADSAATWYLP